MSAGDHLENAVVPLPDNNRVSGRKLIFARKLFDHSSILFGFLFELLDLVVNDDLVNWEIDYLPRRNWSGILFLLLLDLGCASQLIR